MIKWWRYTGSIEKKHLDMMRDPRHLCWLSKFSFFGCFAGFSATLTFGHCNTHPLGSTLVTQLKDNIESFWHWKVLPLSRYNHGSVENCPKWKETTIWDTPIFHQKPWLREGDRRVKLYSNICPLDQNKEEIQPRGFLREGTDIMK